MPVITCDNIDPPIWNRPSAMAFGFSENVNVWRLQVSTCYSLVGRFQSVLDPLEQARAAAYQQESARSQFVIAHGILRFLLAKYLEKAPSDIQFAAGENGKPFIKSIAGIEIHYNVAHSGDWILIAISGNPVGIDVEYKDPEFDYSEVVPACFNFDDINLVQNSADPRSGFYLYWTRKEALIKASARGIDNELPSIPCLDGEHDIDSGILGIASGWDVTSFPVDERHVGSVARQKLTGPLSFWEAKDIMA